MNVIGNTTPFPEILFKEQRATALRLRRLEAAITARRPEIYGADEPIKMRNDITPKTAISFRIRTKSRVFSSKNK